MHGLFRFNKKINIIAVIKIIITNAMLDSIFEYANVLSDHANQ
jgi:hypothetical protein